MFRVLSNVTITRWPVAFSNCGISSTKASRTPFEERIDLRGMHPTDEENGDSRG